MSSRTPDIRPARVEYFEGRRVRISHPEGPEHPAYVHCVERHERRGFTVLPPAVTPPSDNGAPSRD